MNCRFLLLLITASFLSRALSASDCSALTRLHLQRASVTAATAESSGTFAPTGRPVITDLPPFCRVSILARPSADSNIHLEVWLPLRKWNGRFLGQGNGGFAGNIEYADLRSGLRKGFATANSDMGTATLSALNADGLIDHPERWTDWGYRATHVMSSLSKQIIHAYYGRPARFSYFCGCSTGGEQGLSEAQRFPNDYDGILSGAPAYARTRLHGAILWNYRALGRGVTAGLTQAKMRLLAEAVLRSCGTRPNDTGASHLPNPQRCTFLPEILLCKPGQISGCLNREEVESIKQVYQGPVDSSTKSLYPGLSRGSEMEWDLPKVTGSQEEAPYSSIFKWVWGISWDWRQFDFDKDTVRMDAQLGPMVNATNPDLSRFSAAGHKLLLYHGWADPLIAPAGSIQYFDTVLNTEQKRRSISKAEALRWTETYFRLFMIRGMAHCGGGTGPNQLDLLTALQRWVEHGETPSTLPMSRTAVQGVLWREPLCAYPQVVTAQGTQGKLKCTDVLAQFSPLSQSDPHSAPERVEAAH